MNRLKIILEAPGTPTRMTGAEARDLSDTVNFVESRLNADIEVRFLGEVKEDDDAWEGVKPSTAATFQTTSSAYQDAVAFIGKLRVESHDRQHLNRLMQQAIAVAYQNGQKDERRRQENEWEDETNV